LAQHSAIKGMPRSARSPQPRAMMVKTRPTENSRELHKLLGGQTVQIEAQQMLPSVPQKHRGEPSDSGNSRSLPSELHLNIE
jgi:hypothetical protein